MTYQYVDKQGLIRFKELLDDRYALKSDSLNKEISYFLGIRQDGEADADVFERVLGGQRPNDGDIFVIKTEIAAGKFSHTAFVFDSEWKAMDGNYDASNVFFNEDITLAGSYSSVGNVSRSEGVIASKGRSVQDVFTKIFTKELNPSATQPSITATLKGAGAKEVGTVVFPGYSLVFNPGSYTYGPATGVTHEEWDITDGTHHLLSVVDEGDIPYAAHSYSFTVEDDTNYALTIKTKHSEGVIPLTNLGNEYPAARIAAGTKTKKTASITGFRSYFYGAQVEPIALDSDGIRSLNNSGKAAAANEVFEVSIPDGCSQVVIAVPAGRGICKVEDTGAFGTDIFSVFVKTSVNVEGANGYTAKAYNVYTYAPAATLSENTYKVTIE